MASHATFDAATAIAWITRAAELVRAHEQRLNELDAAIGDADHGTNLALGLAEAVAVLAEKAPESPDKVLAAVGRELVGTTGGASGPLYGTGLRRAGKVLDEGGDVTAVNDALDAMLEGIEELGGATLGDKTIVDALAPAVVAFNDAARAHADLPTAARAAADAADQGRLATVPLQAHKGHASDLGAGSVGHEDPGAASTALLLRALADVTAP